MCSSLHLFLSRSDRRSRHSAFDRESSYAFSSLPKHAHFLSLSLFLFALAHKEPLAMPPRQQRKVRVKSSLSAFADADDSDDEKHHHQREEETNDGELPLVSFKGDTRVRTQHRPSFVPKEVQRKKDEKDTAPSENDADDDADDDDENVSKKRKRRCVGEEGEGKEEKKLETRARRDEYEQEHQQQQQQRGQPHNPLSSNVIVKNLPSREDFESLFREESGRARQLFERKILEAFSAFGPIASLSIKKSGNGYNSNSNNKGGSSMAFMAFVAKSSAENAIEKMNSGQFLFYGVKLEASLGGAVVVSEKVWPPAPVTEIRKIANDEDEPDEDDEESRRMLYLDENIHMRGEVAARLTAPAPFVNFDAEHREEEEEGIVKVRFPKDYAQMKRIDITATFVTEDGKAVEHRIKARKKDDPDFAFLFDTIEENEETVYYLWRVFSLANGDSLTSFRTDPFRMFTPNGKIWVPPAGGIEMAPKHNSSSAKDSMLLSAQWPTSNGAGIGASSSLVDYNLDRGETQNALSETDQKHLQELLSLLTLERERVREVTTFAIDHAICAEEVVAKLREEMDAQKESQKPLEAQVSLLYAFSDVLHNASAPVKHASSYRMVIKRALPDVFKALGESLKHCGVIAKPPFMTRVLRVCKAWREWYAFDVSFCDELEETFLGDKVVQ